MIIKTKTVQISKTITEYEASDGKIFDKRSDCETYERSLPTKNIEVIATAIGDGLYDFVSEQPMTLYNIKNEEDWNILVERVWFYRQTEKEFPGPGKYVAVEENCGDHPTEFSIYEYDTYMSYVLHDFNSFYKTMEDAYFEMIAKENN